MSKISVQLLFDQDEFEELQTEADKHGLTVPLYIKSVVVQDSDFDRYYRILLEKVDALPDQTNFTIPRLFGVDWNMKRGIKANLGKTFYNRVMSGVITNAVPTGKDSSNVMWYEKKGGSA